MPEIVHLNFIQYTSILDAINTAVFVIDKDMNIVYINRYISDNLLSEEKRSNDYRLRPAEIFGCKNGFDNGVCICHQSRSCEDCNLRRYLNMILGSQASSTQEVIMTDVNNKMKVLELSYTKFDYEGVCYYTVFSIDKTAAYKKRQLESVFFHDLINLAGGLTGYLDILDEMDAEEYAQHMPNIKSLANQILEDVICQSQISRTEQDRLEPEICEVEMSEFISTLRTSIIYQPCAKNREFIVNMSEEDIIFYSDERILSRVLLNLLKNAAENSDKDDKYTLDITKNNDSITFKVHNNKVIPKETQNHMFSFGNSNKGNGHGVGAYSVRLLTENILKGSAWFTSTEESGTDFFISIPINHPMYEEDNF